MTILLSKIQSCRQTVDILFFWFDEVIGHVKKDCITKNWTKNDFHRTTSKKTGFSILQTQRNEFFQEPEGTWKSISPQTSFQVRT
jgi:hypothetical protein